MLHSVIILSRLVILAASAAFAIIVLVVVASANSALAASSLANGNFETGNLSGWTVDITASGGTASASTSAWFCSAAECWYPIYYVAQEGTYFAQLTPGKLSEDTKISQRFEASAGDKISGWAFVQGDDWNGTTYCDSTGAIAIKSDSGTTVATPFSQCAYGVYYTWYGAPSGWQYWEYTFPSGTATGKFQIEASMRSLKDNPAYGAMGLDNVKTSTGGLDTTAPVAKAPAQSFPTTSSLGTSTIPVKLTWSATDNTGGSGIASYQLQQSVNGGAYTNVTLPSATTITISPSLNTTDTYRFRVAAKDKAGNVSAWAYGPSFKVTAYQESSSSVVDSGTWTTSALSGAYGGSVQYASALGRNASFTVPAGTKNVEWVSTKASDRGKAQVWLAGVQQDADPNLTGIQPFDLYSSSTQLRRVVFSKAVSSATSHKLEVRVLGQKNTSSTGTRVDIDAFVTTS
jgi:hypothetical protein